MSFQAYQQAATRSEDPRSTEYRLFAQVTRALMEASQADKLEITKRAEALDWNRRMWSNFALDCSSEENQLPEQLRASIISLSLFVSKHTSVVMRGDDDFQTLIDINRTIMQGLSPQAQAPAA
ncbi:flagellar biosynthesis regulator FlaF [Maricaulis sp.]|uniref:flagellar biosynthesis regulator FlaF n=1 Tax=unclassified Maricaulis TaxID=2632371 RepID=UPI001B172BD3|nr:flagellar biosynthesis regulator FlaF [Maricaulis sp.]MBO6796793.1 flagellar biosynthesis regulator FlaF [Maricaulis sp.]